MDNGCETLNTEFVLSRYRDFRMLVHLCERDGEPLDRYEERYGEPFAKAKYVLPRTGNC